MKLNDYYIYTQMILSHKQIKKNKNLSKEYIRDKKYNSFNNSNNRNNSYENLKIEENMLNYENQLFRRLYSKTKKLYPTNITKTFKSLISQYENNNYKIPDLSDKKNLFKQNPLLSEGHELEQYFRAINMQKKFNRKQKHINFIKKEMLMLEHITYNRSNDKYHTDNENYVHNKNKRDKNLTKPGINYFHVDNVYDKIKEEKKKIKREELKKRIKQKNKTESHKYIKNDVIHSNFIIKRKDENKSNELEKLKSLTSLSPIKKGYNYTINNYNSKYNMTSKNSDSISTEYKYNNLKQFRSYKTQTIKSISPKKLKFRLLMEEDKNKLLKDIEETKNTINNKDLMEKNIIIENYTNKPKTSKNINEKKNEAINNYNEDFAKLFQNIRRVNDNKKRTSKITKFLTQKIKGPMFLNLFVQKQIKQSIIKKLTKENDPKKIIDMYMKLDLDIFNHNEVEKLMKIYFEKILGYSQESIKKVINLQLGDELICKLIEKYIKKSKEKLFKYSTIPKVNKSLDKANEEIKALKRRYLIGKILQNKD